MNRKFLVFGLTSVFLLAGAGCGKPMAIEIKSKPAEIAATTTPTETTTSTETNTTTTTVTSTPMSIELTATALGKGLVQFNWTIPEGAKNPRSFHLIRGQNENPTQPPSNWFKQEGKSRSAVWVKLPSGKQHFRICSWETNKCEVYSNDVLVDVK